MRFIPWVQDHRLGNIRIPGSVKQRSDFCLFSCLKKEVGEEINLQERPVRAGLSRFPVTVIIHPCAFGSVCQQAAFNCSGERFSFSGGSVLILLFDAQGNKGNRNTFSGSSVGLFNPLGK